MKKIDKTLFDNVTLLYVEDDDMTVEEISFFLKKYIKKLIVAKNGEEGLELYKKHKPDMIITDIQMPKMNGLEMATEILKIDSEIPIVVTTAYSDGDFLIKAIELGIDKYLLKPVNLLEMLAIIQKSLHLGKENCSTKNEYEDYIQFILDSNPTFMFIAHSDKIEYANKSFLELLGHEDIGSLKEHVGNCKDLFKFENLKTEENWIDYIVENNDSSTDSYLVSLNSSSNDNIKSNFYVSYKYFESTNKSVFAFVDTNEKNLNRINSIAKELLDKNNLEGLSLDDLKKIVQLSSRQ